MSSYLHKQSLLEAQTILTKYLPAGYDIASLQCEFRSIRSAKEYSVLISEVLDATDITDDETANRFVASLSSLANYTPLDELGGFAPADIVLWQEKLLGAPPVRPEGQPKCRLAEDMVRFLRALEASPPTLTKVRREFPRKFVRTVNALLAIPDQLDKDFGSSIRTFTSEIEAETVWKLHALSDVGGLARTFKGKFILTKKGRGYLESDGWCQMETLFAVWVDNLNWVSMSPWGSYPYAVQEESGLLTFRLFAVLDIAGKLSVHEADTLLKASLGLKAEGLQEFLLSGLADRMLLRWWQYFGLVRVTAHRREYGIDLHEEYALTPLGRYFLSLPFSSEYRNNP